MWEEQVCTRWPMAPASSSAGGGCHPDQVRPRPQVWALKGRPRAAEDAGDLENLGREEREGNPPTQSRPRRLPAVTAGGTAPAGGWGSAGRPAPPARGKLQNRRGAQGGARGPRRLHAQEAGPAAPGGLPHPLPQTRAGGRADRALGDLGAACLARGGAGREKESRGGSVLKAPAEFTGKEKEETLGQSIQASAESPAGGAEGAATVPSCAATSAGPRSKVGELGAYKKPREMDLKGRPSNRGGERQRPAPASAQSPPRAPPPGRR